MKSKLKKFIFIAFSFILLHSCIKGSQSIILNNNGSAQIEFNFEITKHQHTLLLLSQKSFLTHSKENGTYKSIFFDEQKIRKKLLKKYVGIDIHSFRYQEKNNYNLYQLKIDIANLQDALKQGFLQGMTFEEYKKNEWSLLWQIPTHKNNTISATLLDGLNLTIKLNTPQKIIDSNGHKKEPKTLLWHITAKNIKDILSQKYLLSALIQGDYSHEKQLIKEQNKKKFFGFDE